MRRLGIEKRRYEENGGTEEENLVFFSFSSLAPVLRFSIPCVGIAPSPVLILGDRGHRGGQRRAHVGFDLQLGEIVAARAAAIHDRDRQACLVREAHEQVT